MKLFEFDEHIGDWRVLVGSRDVANGAILSRHIGAGEVKSRNIGAGEVKSGNIGDKEVKGRNIGDKEVKNRHIGDGELTSDKIGEGEVKTPNIEDKAVTNEKIDDEAITPDKLSRSLLNEIRSAGKHGYALATEFGDSDVIGVSQRALTDAFNRVWEKLEEMTGESYQGVRMVVSPDYFFGGSEETCVLNISARTANTNGIFERIEFYEDTVDMDKIYAGEVDEEHLMVDTLGREVKGSNVAGLDADVECSGPVTVICIGKIMGIIYRKEKLINRYEKLWLFAASDEELGDNLSNIGRFLTTGNAITVGRGMRGAYNLNVAEGKKIVIVMGQSMTNGFYRADINGVEIKLSENNVTVDDNAYTAFVSVNTFINGSYNIDING